MLWQKGQTKAISFPVAYFPACPFSNFSKAVMENPLNKEKASCQRSKLEIAWTRNVRLIISFYLQSTFLFCHSK